MEEAGGGSLGEFGDDWLGGRVVVASGGERSWVRRSDAVDVLLAEDAFRPH
jgi:hypothetical protein